jgi:triosephosphate isomerase
MAGNWKMNLNHLEAIAVVQKLAFSLTARDTDLVEVAVLPPFTDIRSVQTLIDADRVPIAFGGQDLSAHDSGAYTGEVSGAMLAKLSSTYVIVGHSERRQYHAEDDAVVNAKAKQALKGGVTPIVCVGEGLDHRQDSRHVNHCVDQVFAALDGLSDEQVASLVIAYEPVWAIGTGEVATPDDAQEVCAAIRAELAEQRTPQVAEQVRILYGGSVKAANVAAIMAQPDVDGCLVGGASLVVEEFAAIARFYDLPAL